MIVWIAGWPHNGSTLCRQILKDAFDLPTYSRYLESELKNLFRGSEEFSKRWDSNLSGMYGYALEHNESWLIKTHELPTDNSPAIFLIRDGRDVMCSLSNFWRIPVRCAIAGQYCYFGGWSEYYYGWNPKKRAKTLFVRYEDMVETPNEVAVELEAFLGVKQVRQYVDDFEERKKQYPYLFKDRTGIWRKMMSEYDLKYFWKCHGNLMRELGYG